MTVLSSKHLCLKSLENVESFALIYPLSLKCTYSFSYACATEKSKHPDIDLCSMTCGTAAVRRLSTASSVTKPPHYILTTEWLWYWEDEYGVWNEYGKQVSHV